MSKLTGDFASRIAIAMDEAHISGRQLAKRLGCTDPLITAYKNGKATPKAARLQEIASILGVNAAWLLGFDEPMHDEKPEGAYYFDAETAQIAEEIRTDHELRILFDLSRKTSPEKLKLIQSVLKSMVENDNNEGI